MWNLAGGCEGGASPSLFPFLFLVLSLFLFLLIRVPAVLFLSPLILSLFPSASRVHGHGHVQHCYHNTRETLCSVAL